MLHKIVLSNGHTLILVEDVDRLHIADECNGDINSYICEINPSGVLVMPNSGEAPEWIARGLTNKEAVAVGETVVAESRHTPVATQRSSAHCVLTVKFEREVNHDELDILRDNFNRGRIKHDPSVDLAKATAEQFTNELQEAYGSGSMIGSFEVAAVEMGRAFVRPPVVPA